MAKSRENQARSNCNSPSPLVGMAILTFLVMAPVIQPNADNFFRAGHHRAVPDAVFFQQRAISSDVGMTRCVYQSIQPRAVFTLQQFIHGGWRGHMQQLCGARDIQDSPVYLHSKAVAALADYSQQRETTSQAARAVRGSKRPWLGSVAVFFIVLNTFQTVVLFSLMRPPESGVCGSIVLELQHFSRASGREKEFR